MNGGRQGDAVRREAGKQKTRRNECGRSFAYGAREGDPLLFLAGQYGKRSRHCVYIHSSIGEWRIHDSLILTIERCCFTQFDNPQLLFSLLN